MLNKPTLILLSCAISSLILYGCKKEEEEETKNIPLQESVQPSQISEGQRKRDSILEGFNAQLKTLEEQINVANTRISKMGKKKNWAWRTKLDVIEAKKKKVVDEAISLEKHPDGEFASGLSRLNTSLELLSRDVNQLLKKMK